MKTNKYLLYIAAAVLAAIAFAACETESDYYDTGFYRFNVSIIYPQHEHKLFPKESSYLVLVDGDTVKGVENFVDRAERTHRVQVFLKGNDTPLLDDTIRVIGDGQGPRLIILGDGSVHNYSPEKQTRFNLNQFYLPGQGGNYRVVFRSTGGLEQVMDNGVNYLPNEQTSGTLRVEQNGEVVYSQDVTFTAESLTELMQIDKQTFLDVTIPEGEADPAGKDRAKVRFVIDDATTGVTGNARITVTDGVAGTELATFDFHASQLSPFVELDNAGTYRYTLYNMADAENPVLVRQNIVLNFDTRGIYKFQTIRAKKYTSNFEFGTKW